MAKRNRRAEIMQAAEKLFTSRRFHEITLDDVVQEARVGKGTVYLYFKDKDDLFFQTAMRGFDELCELLTRKIPEGAPFAEQLLECCTQISAFFRRRRQLFRMMQAEEARMRFCDGEPRSRWREHRKRLVLAMAGVLAKGVREGRVRGDVPAEVLAHMLLGMLRTRTRDLGDVPEPCQSLELVVELFCRGAEARASAGPCVAAAPAAAPRAARRSRPKPGGLQG